ncbi:MAG: efflux RND transporter periplasmic adaptor subunit [Anaeromyxobacter sp.]
MPHLAARRTAVLTALALAALAAAGCSASRADQAAPADPAIPVRALPLAGGPVDRPVRAAATVAPRDERALAFKVGGVVARVDVREGQRVRRGQVLALLDDTEVAAGAAQAREALAKAERDLVRARALAEADVVARATLEDAETGARVARAAADAAAFNLRRAALVAPDDGWAEARLAEPGEVVAAGQPIVRVSGRGQGWVVRASLPDRDVLGLRPGQPATVTVDARPGRAIAGTLAEIARSATRGTGTYEVEVRLDPAAAPDLLGGLTAKLEIPRTVDAPAAVPLAALVDADGATGAVFTVEGGRARRVPVRIAFLQGDRAVLAERPSGISSVVVEGAARLADGAPVQVVE